MSCHTFQGVTICRPDFDKEVGRLLLCPKCNKVRRIKVCFYSSYADYFGIGRCAGKRRKWKHMAICGYEFRFGGN